MTNARARAMSLNLRNLHHSEEARTEEGIAAVGYG